jgi:DNA-binding XRE family transcriptional regulator
MIRFDALLRCDPCAYCGAPMEEIDHIAPRARGGEDNESNLTASCARCNQSKGARSLLEFLLKRNRPLTPVQQLKRGFGDRMRSRRLELGITQSELARALDTDLMAISRWERGTSGPRARSALAVAQALGKPLAWFYETPEEVAA